MTAIDERKLDKVWAVVLAAGKGTRMKAKEKNKVAYSLNGVPMVTRTINILREAGVVNILVVVGHAKESVLALLDEKIQTVEQRKRLGTGHAVMCALEKIPQDTEHVIVLNGDDSFLFSPDLLKQLFRKHTETNSEITFLTIEMDNPTGLGRIERDGEGKIVDIVEEKDASEKQKNIKEINAACYLFAYDFLNKSINKIKKSKTSGEYYIVSLVEIAVKAKKRVEALMINKLKWRGVNTPEELEEAEMLVA